MAPTVPPQSQGVRRPIKARGSAWAQSIAAHLVRWNIRPNTISLLSILFAALAAACLLTVQSTLSFPLRTTVYLLAGLGIQGRLICNLLDGMVAIEGARKSKSGEIFNDLPDRISDPLILVAAGYATGIAWGIEMGWVAALLSLLTAYVRVLGQSAGAGASFIGPMAKQHRMATLTAACLAAAILSYWQWDALILATALGLIILGCVITFIRRLRQIITALERP